MPRIRLGCRGTQEVSSEGLTTGRLQRTAVCVLLVLCLIKALTENVGAFAEAARRTPAVVGSASEAVPAGAESHFAYPGIRSSQICGIAWPSSEPVAVCSHVGSIIRIPAEMTFSGPRYVICCLFGRNPVCGCSSVFLWRRSVDSAKYLPPSSKRVHMSISCHVYIIDLYLTQK